MLACSGFRNRGEMYPDYPTPFEKKALAKDIVGKIPELRLTDRRNPLGFVIVMFAFLVVPEL